MDNLTHQQLDIQKIKKNKSRKKNSKTNINNVKCDNMGNTPPTP